MQSVFLGTDSGLISGGAISQYSSGARVCWEAMPGMCAFLYHSQGELAWLALNSQSGEGDRLCSHACLVKIYLFFSGCKIAIKNYHLKVKRIC